MEFFNQTTRGEPTIVTGRSIRSVFQPQQDWVETCSGLMDGCRPLLLNSTIESSEGDDGRRRLNSRKQPKTRRDLKGEAKRAFQALQAKAKNGEIAVNSAQAHINEVDPFQGVFTQYTFDFTRYKGPHADGYNPYYQFAENNYD
jgi:hypothetical protein